MKPSSYLPFLTLTTANAAALLPRSPQGPDSNPGEFIDPALSHSNPQNNKPAPPGPYLGNLATMAIQKPVPETTSPAGPSLPNYSILPAPTPTTTLPPTPTITLPPSASTSDAADATDLQTLLGELTNSTTYLANETYPYYYGPNYTNTKYPYPPHHHHHHYYNSTYWNTTSYLNLTEYYNTTSNIIELVFGEPNGTTKTEYFNVTELNVTEPYGYGFYNGSGRYNYKGGFNGTDGSDNATATTGAGGANAVETDVVRPYDLTAKPGFTGPKKGKRGLGLGRWLSGVL